MKILFPFLFLFPLFCNAQLFDPTTTWFEDEDFFNQESAFGDDFLPDREDVPPQDRTEF